ncbi:ATP-binding protein [Nocardioides currus]|uniref:histidine kinase n=1 Tax=Nocardioides currus TaxID=2133958 RepID=A0A2R7Z2W8_9ACTN|nr:ATP-binding protein [Nocardioides currus]PUA82968.1 histidine kinase [Nocardioides currus]
MDRGRLTVFLGMAPGVGKTFAMLDEAHRRVSRGADVVVGIVETHDRPRTAALLEGLEVVPRRVVGHRGAEFGEMDTDAILARRPAVVLVDELAHTNVPGSLRAKRHEDVDVLRNAGIDVVTTLNIQHLESLNEVVQDITGVQQRETVPDAVVRAADQVQLVDMSPEGLRRRLAHGNVYRAEQIDASLASFFRPGNLIALRELALLWLADRVDTALDDYRRTQGIDQTWPTRERVVVAVTGGPESETLLRRAGRIAQRGAGGELVAVHVVRGDGLTGPAADLAGLKRLVDDLGGTFHTVVGEDVPTSVIEFARGVNATLVVVGVSSHPRWWRVFRQTTASDLARLSGAIDVHLVTHEQAGGAGGLRVPRSTLGATRTRTGWVLALLLPVLLTWLFHGGHSPDDFPLEVLAFLAATVLVALVGGLVPALVAAVVGFGLLNWFFTTPVGRFTISEPTNVVALAVFLAVATGVASVVDIAARRASEAGRARAEATTLSGLAQSVLTGSDTAQAVVDRLREAFGLTAVALLRRTPSGWDLVSAAGDVPDDADSPDGPDATTVAVDATHVLRLHGRTLHSSDMRVVEAFALQAGLVLEYRRLRDREARAAVLERAEETSTALLRAVSHDLRTPLATMRTSVDGLVAGEALSEDDRTSLLTSIRSATDQLVHLIDNLLDLSRISSGLVEPRLTDVSLEEVLPVAVAGHPSDRLVLDLDEATPFVRTDPGLLERVVANLADNAVRHSPPDRPVRVGVHLHADTIEVRVVDRGPGVPSATRGRMFEPFQRLGDASPGGLGLGLAVARGLASSMGASVAAEDTPGGGLTLVVSVPRASSDPLEQEVGRG